VGARVAAARHEAPVAAAVAAARPRPRSDGLEQPDGGSRRGVHVLPSILYAIDATHLYETQMATPRAGDDNSLEAARAAAVVAAAAPMPAPPVQRRRSVEPCLAELIDDLKLKPAQAESLEQLLDEHEVHDLATAQILDAEDFKEIGVKVGTRKKLLERLASSTSEA
jgi:hypothetical protein